MADVINALGTVGTIAGAILAAVAAIGLIRAAFNRSVGRRWAAQRRLSRLATGVQVRYFASILGEPAIKSAQEEVVEYVFVDPLFYVHVLANDADDSVLQFAVTVRNPRFHPKIRWWTVSDWQTVTLGKTSFAAFGHAPTAIGGALGAHNFGYSETYYFGNPGGYQSYILAINDAGGTWEVEAGDFNQLFGSDGLPILDPADIDAAEFANSGQAARFRAKALPNTYGLTAPNLQPVWNPWFAVGVDVNLVRVIP